MENALTRKEAQEYKERYNGTCFADKKPCARTVDGLTKYGCGGCSRNPATCTYWMRRALNNVVQDKNNKTETVKGLPNPYIEIID